MNAELISHIRINTTLKTKCKPDWSWDTTRKRFADFDLWGVLGGRGRMKTLEGVFDIGAGDCFILRPGNVYKGSHDPEFPLSVIAIHFDFCNSRGRPFHPDESVLPVLYRRMENVSFFIQLLERVYEMAFEKRFEERLHWFKTVLMEVMNQDLNRQIYQCDPLCNDFIEELCRDMKDNPERRYNLKSIAEKACYCPDHFSRLFKNHTGLSFKNYQLQARISAAKSLLKSTDYSIGRIAELLGYQDVYLFSSQFKKKTGASPTLFRGKIEL